VGFSTAEETHLNGGGSILTLPAGFPQDTRYNHDTVGVKLDWPAAASYDIGLQAGVGGFDASAFSHLNLRVGKRAPIGAEVNLTINIQDTLGNSANFDMQSQQWDTIPAQYRVDNAMMTGVRIPLHAFTQFNSGVDLSQLFEINITVDGSEEIAIDEIEFTN